MRSVTWIRSQSATRVVVVILVAVAAAGPVVVGLEAFIRARLHDGLYQSPTRYFARPTTLFPGMAIERAHLAERLERLGYTRARNSLVEVGQYRLGARTWEIGRRPFRVGKQLTPSLEATIRVGYDGRVWSIRDPQGQRVPSLTLEPEVLPTPFSGPRVERMPIVLEEVPPHLVSALVAIEDQRFFDHGGLDVRRIVGALIANVRAGRVTQGASTLSQQLAKNLYLSPRRTPLRKLRELAMALVLERRHTKAEILAAYLNQVYLGQDGAVAIHGVGRAAQFYFGKDVSRLELHEAALLAGIIKGPSYYSPRRHPQRATERRNLVLQMMRRQGTLDTDAYERASNAPLAVTELRRRGRSGRHFADYLTRQLREQHGRRAVERGLTVFTTLDMDLQILAEEVVDERLAQLERANRHLKQEGTRPEGALVALDPRSGEILAIVGSRDYGRSQFNRALNARRQPGSAFKPVVALTALSRPHEYTLATILKDAPLAVQTPTGVWQPVNYDGRFRGRVSLREALERSLNVPFARLGMHVGPERIVAVARELGIQSALHPVPSLALGASEVSPLELTRAYGVLAAEGFRADLHTTLLVLDGAGEELSRFEFSGERVFDPAEAYLVTSALQGSVERGTGRALRRMGYRGPVAAKSGTSNDFRDAWFIAYTPSLAVGVWVGYDDGRSLRLSGSRAALPIVGRFLAGAVGPFGDLDFTVPPGIDVVEVDRETGLRAGPGCRGEPEVFLRGTAPEESCSPFWASEWGDRRGRSRFRRELSYLVDELLRRLAPRRGRQ